MSLHLLLPLSLPDVRGVIVDLDGTMVDTLGDFVAALNRMLAELDLPPVNRALVERTVGKGSEHLIRSVLKHQLALPGVHVQGRLGTGCTDELIARAAREGFHLLIDVGNDASRVSCHQSIDVGLDQRSRVELLVAQTLV